jgi:hypothetical protein
MLIKILIGIAGLVAVFCVVVALQPSEFSVSRSAVIAAPAPVVFTKVNDLHTWQEFSPWAKMDPNAKVAFAGPAAGEGASFTWAGNNQVGEGTMTVIESRPAERVRFRLDFLKPFKSTSEALFTFEPDGAGTRVTWTMTGRNNFMFKAVGLFIDCDKMIGPQFEQGLANLKTLSETKS